MSDFNSPESPMKSEAARLRKVEALARASMNDARKEGEGSESYKAAVHRYQAAVDRRQAAERKVERRYGHS